MKKQYICPWCHEQFEKNVSYKPRLFNPINHTSETGAGHGSANSTPVKCPGCGNLIPTWKKEATNSFVGRKHIHLRS